jgi:putative acetyltransferase
MAVIRREQPGEGAAVREVILQAMRPREADAVDAIRAHGKAVLSLVAVLDSKVVGHVLFSPMTFDSVVPPLPALGLGPLAVVPEHQHKGLGSALVEEGLAECRRLGYGSIFLLGDPAYYGRFGFRPARLFGVRPPTTPRIADAFQVVELQEDALLGVSGIAREAEELG